MKNLRMREKLDLGECVDVNKIGRVDGPGVFVLTRYVDGVDYCDAANDQWIWSIGKDVDTGEIVAATDTRFYQHPQYVCLWLR
jgi:hypothetical protein